MFKKFDLQNWKLTCNATIETICTKYIYVHHKKLSREKWLHCHGCAELSWPLQQVIKRGYVHKRWLTKLKQIINMPCNNKNNLHYSLKHCLRNTKCIDAPTKNRVIGEWFSSLHNVYHGYYTILHKIMVLILLHEEQFRNLC